MGKNMLSSPTSSIFEMTRLKSFDCNEVYSLRNSCPSYVGNWLKFKTRMNENKLNKHIS